MVIFRRFFRHIKEGFLGVVRHFGMAISSANAVSITLLLVGLFLVLTLNLNVLASDIEGSISLSALIDYEVTSEPGRENIRKQIEHIEGVSSVEYRSKEEEFDYYVTQYSDEGVKEFYELYRDDNPFHDVFLVSCSDANLLGNIKDRIASINGIYSVYDGGSSTYKLVSILNNIRLVGAVLVLALLVLAVYLIYNTIKITIASRSDEIGIMKNVGARNSYIRAPFLVEGIIIGVLGSIIPIAAIDFGYYYLYNLVDGILFGVITLIPLLPFLQYLSLALLLVGVVVGFIGSFISVCKFLRKRR